MKAVPSPNFNKGRAAPVRVIVIHSTEAPEGPQTAENVAAYFAKSSTKASSHLVVDNNSEVRCVEDKDTAWCAPGANADGLQLELAGYARQTRKDWLDDYSSAMLQRTAVLVAEWCKKYEIPVVKLTQAELRAGKRGLTSHADVTAVYKRSDHTDPGASFPWDWFLAAVQEALDGPKQEDKPVATALDTTKVMVPIGDYYGPFWKGEHYPLSFVLIAAATEAKFAKEAATRTAANLDARLGRIEYALSELSKALTTSPQSPETQEVPIP